MGHHVQDLYRIVCPHICLRREIFNTKLIMCQFCYYFIILLSVNHLTKPQWSLTFLSPGTGFVEDNFSMDWSQGGWFSDDLRTLHLLCTLFLLLLHQLHLRSSRIRSWRLGTPVIQYASLSHNLRNFISTQHHK